MFWSGVLKFVSENDLYIRMCPWPHAWKSTLTDLSKLCLSNCSLQMRRKDVLDRAQLKSPQVCWPSCHLPQQLQRLAELAPDSRGWTTFTPTQRARTQMKQWRGWEKTEKQPLIWWTFALSTATKITVGFLFPGEAFWRASAWSVMSLYAVPWVWQSAPGHLWSGAGNLICTKTPQW